MKTSYLLIAHGSRQDDGNQALFDLVARFQKAYPKRVVEGCFLDVVHPSIPEGIEACVHKGAQAVLVIPLMIFPGKHVREDIPRYIQQARKQYPDVDFHYGTALHDHPLLLDLLDKKAKALKP